MTCRSIDELKSKIVDVLSNDVLTFDEIYSRLRTLCGSEINKFLVREALASLVREGLVERLRGDEVRGIPRMVFRVIRGRLEPRAHG